MTHLLCYISPGNSSIIGRAGELCYLMGVTVTLTFADSGGVVKSHYIERLRTKNFMDFLKRFYGLAICLLFLFLENGLQAYPVRAESSNPLEKSLPSRPQFPSLVVKASRTTCISRRAVMLKQKTGGYSRSGCMLWLCAFTNIVDHSEPLHTEKSHLLLLWYRYSRLEQANLLDN